MLSLEFFPLGEIIHGSDKEKFILSELKEKFGGSLHTIKTKEWVIENFELYVNGKKVNGSLLPYTSGYVKGKVGKEIRYYEMPPHPFMVKDLYDKAVAEGYKGVIFFDQGKLRRISVGSKIPAVFSEVPLKDGDEVEIYSKSYLRENESYNLEVEAIPGEDYIVIGAHVDHWLSGYHDNLFSLDIIEGLKVELKHHGLKFLFFSSEEGPRCCNGSFQHKKDNTFIMISLDALFPNRVVFSATPDLFQFSQFFNVKRIEMPTPFSDHFSYVLEGYPAMVLYNDDLIPWYHSDKDLPLNEDKVYLKEIIQGLRKMLEKTDNVTKEELDKIFFDYAKQQGFEIKERKGSIIPLGLTSTFKKLQ
ncbi:M28 family peptidase [Sulfurisphaera ohwakuensis]|uniref:Iap family predicted aminopeptidase n=1 Tax=Sulfurisphaera ohwakuensis TaxID=69656 RepID=A0A650CIK5_SULOH|nr:M28 family peptidase [Sulfurisphaera ohwakuensis]MBB5254558.1 Iap family predicted aminopeptidase [Sulfurisphaera ohwakuensis]QGR17606.1 Zn-dependent exopeptidase M28 [Sulfurisphaera ohwakuensis]